LSAEAGHPTRPPDLGDPESLLGSGRPPSPRRPADFRAIDSRGSDNDSQPGNARSGSHEVKFAATRTGSPRRVGGGLGNYGGWRFGSGKNTINPAIP
jgi:hypothetical protein